MRYEKRPKNQARSYTQTAIGLHWLIALALAANFALGVGMHELPLSPQKLQLYAWHKWAGVTLFGLVTLRLIWRKVVPPPELLPAPAWQQFAARLLHNVLYILMFAIPLSGWLMSSAAGFPVVYLGVLPLPDLVPKNKELYDAFKKAHEALIFSLLLLVIVHTAAALKHHFIDHDATLTRILPWQKK